METTKADSGWLSWPTVVQNRYFGSQRRRFCWQPAGPFVRDADVIVLEQASRLVLNYRIFARRGHRPKVALWGHGANLDRAAASRVGELVKRWYSQRADWWFAYTEGTRDRLAELGFDLSRVTVVRNSVDAVQLQRAADEVTSEARDRVVSQLRLGVGPRALVLGSIYERKHPEFVVMAADAIRARVAGFELLVVGGGPALSVYTEASSSRPWLHILGVRKGIPLAEIASTCELILNPGLVGLVAVDSFALRLPIVTRRLPYHSPEFEYLSPGENAVVMDADVTADQYASQVVSLLEDPCALRVLHEGCMESAGRYSAESMAALFADGLLQLLRESRPN